MIEWRHELRDDPLLLVLATAPLEDEEITPEEETAVAEAREEVARGEVYSLDEVKRELGLRAGASSCHDRRAKTCDGWTAKPSIES